MDFRQIKTFLTVVDTGNITRAADILHIVQPAVSRQIKLLEEDLGTPLFERQRHGMVLTESGKLLVNYARRAVLELDRARAAISGAQQGVGGLVTLGLLPSTIDALSGPLLSALAKEHPGIQLRLAMGYAGTLLRWLENGEIDAALLYGAERSADIQCEPLIEEPLWVLWSPHFKIKQAKSFALKDLAKYPMILPSTPHGIRTLVDHACAKAEVTLQIAAEANALSVQKSLSLGGHGLTILPPIAVHEDLKSGQLMGAPLTGPAITRTIVLALPANRPIAQHVRCTVDLLTECARSAVSSGVWLQGKWLA